MGTTSEQRERIQRTDWGQGWTVTRETPAFRLYLPEFQISRYPITQAQFEAFISAEDGYFEPMWWTEMGWAWMQKEGGPLVHQIHVYPNMPRTCVSWYEAVAFCNWLSKTLGCKISLPTEAQWEKAARSPDGRLFSWGDEFDSGKCNWSLSGMNGPTIVGCYLLRDAPWGAHGPIEMTGNVWEWCTTISERLSGEAFSYPYDPSDGRENLELGDEYYRIVRGGSYINPPFLQRTAYRGRDRPYERWLRHGFRIVRTVDRKEHEDVT